MSIEVVVTDQAMPHMTGAELARAIAAERPDLPVILATGYAELADAEPALPKLSKPFRQEDLVQALRLAVRRADTSSRVVRLRAT